MKIQEGNQIYSIAEVNQSAKLLLEEMIFWVEGEISAVQKDPKWFNAFITLKDENSTLPCFIESTRFANLPEMKVGDKILAYGNLTLFKKNEYKFKIAVVKLTGGGVLQQEFQKLYEKLSKEGLFDESKKQKLPKYPKKICVITSMGSAGWHDFKTMSVDKFPLIELFTMDITVGGRKAISQIVNRLPRADEKGFDVIVITRGGGQEESLIEVFNDESVVRTIAKMKTPTVVAIGHEINVTLAELAADVRASTPTDAANIIVSSYINLEEKLENVEFYLNTKLRRLFAESQQLLDSFYFRLSQAKVSFRDLPHRLNTAESYLEKHKKHLLFDAQGKTSLLKEQMFKNIYYLIQAKDNNESSLNKSLQILSPQNTLDRGYSITYNQNGQIIKTIAAVEQQSSIGVKLRDGLINAKVKSTKKDG